MGLPHAPIDKDWTAIMRPAGFYCDDDDKRGDKKICDLQDYDFEKFLFPYNPERAMTPVEWKKEKARKERERYLDNLCMHLGGRRRGICF